MVEIEGYKGKYSITKNGDVYSHRKKSFMRWQNNGNGYAYVSLHINRRKKNFYIHRLVAQAFIKNTNNLPCVNHKDFNKLNNKASNLEWVSHKENTAHAYRAGVVKDPPILRGNKHSRSVLKEKEVFKIKAMISNGIACTKIAKMFNVHSSTIYHIKHGRAWSEVKKKEE